MQYNFQNNSCVKFHITKNESNDDLEVYEIMLQPDGIKIEPHYHENTEEFFYVLEGEFLFHADGREFPLKQGDSYLVKRGIAHGFCPLGNKPARILASSHNQGRMEKYVSTLSSLINSGNATDEKLSQLVIQCDQKRITGTHEFVQE